MSDNDLIFISFYKIVDWVLANRVKCCKFITNFSEAFIVVKVWHRAQKISVGCKTIYEIDPRPQPPPRPHLHLKHPDFEPTF